MGPGRSAASHALEQLHHRCLLRRHLRRRQALAGKQAGEVLPLLERPAPSAQEGIRQGDRQLSPGCRPTGVRPDGARQAWDQRMHVKQVACNRTKRLARPRPGLAATRCRKCCRPSCQERTMNRVMALSVCFACIGSPAYAQDQRPGDKLVFRDVDWGRPCYETSFDSPDVLKGWKLEGGKQMSIVNGRL